MIRLFLFILCLMVCSANAQQVTGLPFLLVNSIYDEQNPIISPDGKILYFTVANHPNNIGGKKDPGDIWFAAWTGKSWSTPEHAGSVLNNENYNCVLGISSDGSQMYLAGHRNLEGSKVTQGISFSRLTSAGWTAPENITIPYFLNRSQLFSGSMSRDGKSLIYSAEGYESKGAEDIYITFLNEDRWSEPINLGSQINTESQELSPVLSDDGKTIFFATNGRKGLGSFDIYQAVRLDDSWKGWTSPLNLQAPVNSAMRELYYRPYRLQRMALFTTTSNSDGYGDIREWVDTLYTAQVDTVLKITEIRYDPHTSGSRTVLISGMVTDANTGKPLFARITFKSDSVFNTSSSITGNYQIGISSTKEYNIEIDAPGYVNLAERLDIHTFAMKTLEMNFRLQPIEIGTVVNLKSILFSMGTTTLLPESYPELNVVVTFLQNNPKVEIELEGHTDNRGDSKKNLILSEQRVDKIKSYLVSKGIGQRRIRGKGYGGTRPIAGNNEEESRKLNRRVEFMIIKD